MDDYGQELHIHGANEVFTGWVISPHNVATEEPKKEPAKNTNSEKCHLNMSLV